MTDALSTELPRLLIVDDEPTNIHVLTEALKGDYRIQFALNGSQTLAKAASGHIDLILLDLVMPDMDGFEVLRRLKLDSATQDIPVIFVTASDDEAAEERGLRLGAVDYVLKPFRPAVVRARIDTHLDIKRQRDLLEQYAMLDGLTEIPNRRRFDDALDRQWRAALRSGEPVTLIIVDVDRFKAYNDHYGHAVGDRCLRRIAQHLSSQFSRGDELVARYGGEEFAILTAQANLQQLEGTLERLIKGVYDLTIDHSESPLRRVTISAGATRAVPDPGQSANSLVEMADTQLYRAKNGGRNRAYYRDESLDESGSVAGPACADSSR